MEELRKIEEMARLLVSMFNSFDKIFGMSEISPEVITGEPVEDSFMSEKKKGKR